MEVRCRTNLDLRGESWPTELPALPRVGDRIQSGTVHHTQERGEFVLELEVCAVSWECSRRGDVRKEWMPRIELHMTSWQRKLRPASWRDPGAAEGSIVAFYDWYAPLVGTTASAFI